MRVPLSQLLIDQHGDEAQFQAAYSVLLERRLVHLPGFCELPGDTVPGDVVVFWHNTKHAAFGGSKRRRMFTMNFYEHVPDNRLVDFQDALANEGFSEPRRGFRFERDGRVLSYELGAFVFEKYAPVD